MSFLAPAYLAALAAVAAPILFHLIRRKPHGVLPFSSLMFLSPSPPRLTRRSRLEHWLLLLLRATALILLALAFARPVWLRHDVLAAGQHGQLVALLVDSSASMQRPEVWRSALEQAERWVLENQSARLALYHFNRSVHPVVPVETALQRPPSPAQVLSALRRLQPGWERTDLGNALVDVADALDRAAARSQQPTARLVVISDLQRGAQAQALQGYPWPRGVQVQWVPARPRHPTSQAALHWVRQDPRWGTDLRVRVVNQEDSRASLFTLQWRNKEDQPIGKGIQLQLPAGQSRIVRVPRPDGDEVDRLVLAGDEEPLGNILYVAPLQIPRFRLLYAGRDEAGDPRGLHYYLQRAVQAMPQAEVQITAWDGQVHAPEPSPWLERLETADAVVLAAPWGEGELEGLRRFLVRGGRVLLVLAQPSDAHMLARLLGIARVDCREAPIADYALLAHLQFDDPVFAPFAAPAYRDFSKIHFWKYRRVVWSTEQQETAPEVLARFDTGDPFLCRWAVGSGSLYLMTSGWHPEDSQLGRSTKFVPMLWQILFGGTPSSEHQAVVGDGFPLPSVPAGQTVMVIQPDGTRRPVDPASTPRFVPEQPGLYRVEAGGESIWWGVNLPGVEADLLALEPEDFAALGVPGESAQAARQIAAARREAQLLELEAEQRLWWWLVLALVLLLIAETVVAGWTARRTARTVLAPDA